MSHAIFLNALQLTLSLTWPFVVAAVVGVGVSGIFRVMTQIDDAAIGFAGKLAALAALIYFYGTHAFGQILSFAERLWGGTDFY